MQAYVCKVPVRFTQKLAGLGILLEWPAPLRRHAGLKVALIALLTVGLFCARDTSGQGSGVVEPIGIQETGRDGHASVESLNGQNGEVGCPI
jgi:hypothetical protein